MMRVSVCGSSGRSALVLLCALAASGCANTRRNGDTPARPGSGGTSSAGSSASGGGPGTLGGAGGSVAAELAAVPSELHRLNATEYRATVEDVLGTPVEPASWLYGTDLAGFDNIAAVLNVTPAIVDSLLDSAEKVAHDVFATDTAKAKVVTCTAADDLTCVASVISSSGLRLFRRPLSGEEVAVYQKVYTAARVRGDAHEPALQQVLVALLSSAQFLYRMEFPSQAAGTQPLGPYEVASRLSYLIWSSAPDDALLAEAEAGTLADDDALAAQTARLWADPKALRFTENFGGQWLGARRLDYHPVAADVFPEWNDQVRAAAQREIYDSFKLAARAERPWVGFLTGYPHEIDGALAPLYGLPQAAAGTPVLLDSAERRGYLGSIGFLTLSSFSHRTSPTSRGKIVLENLLCEPLNPPPPDAPILEEASPAARTLREKIEQISETERCAECHELIDPIGLALEHYDAIGGYRDVYPEGDAVDSNVRLAPWPGHPEGELITGLAGVISRVESDPAFMKCLIHKLYTYGLGRAPGAVDERNVAALAAEWSASDLTVGSALRQLVLSTPFRFRNEGAEP